MPKGFSAETLAKASRDVRLERAPEGANVGVTAQGGEVGVEGAVSKSFGKDKSVFVQGEGSWFRSTGYRVAAYFGWTPKS